MNEVTPGQRWTSDAEPELGLGLILQVDDRSVTVRFPASDALRRYARGAPLRRVRFHAGDRVNDQSGEGFTVLEVEEENGLLTYRGEGRSLEETELSDLTSFSTPAERLGAGQVDRATAFELRRETLAVYNRVLHSPVRGFIGGRVDLIPHQLYIAREVADRHAPRVLLADEVGLGKTIEACLILHRLLVNGRINRVLILVPTSLLHQWLVELMRRFNLRFNLFDEDRCESIETSQPGENPFLDDQLVLASIDFLAGDPNRAEQALAGQWDVLVVDEAHHLEWDTTAVSREYQLIESIARATPGLLLLTGTPARLGLTGHFARLRLLDPDRYPDFEQFLDEAGTYTEVAQLADRLRRGESLDSSAQDRLAELFHDHSTAFRKRLARASSGDSAARQQVMAELIDQHGTGRVMFRNRRSAMTGFPKREAHPTPLAATATRSADLNSDPRIAWLVELLARLADQKVLLIAHTRERAQQIDDALQKRIRVKTALFHEGLTLLQRDRNAAYFADPRGARLLLCSEIGSEGRNFQFAHHLVLFDLPLDPDLLEQRIGRLDRIGQTETIHVHFPWLENSDREVLAHWHHRGLDDIAHSLRGGQHMMTRFGDRVTELGQARLGGEATATDEAIDALVAETRIEHERLQHELEDGRDHLLELTSFRPSQAEELVREIESIDSHTDSESLFLRLLEANGVYAERIAERTHLLNPDSLSTPDFPELERGEVAVTFDRARALVREDVLFMSWDHPLFLRAFELLLGSETGNSAFALWPDSSSSSSMFAESMFVVECIAPAELHIDRFLAPTPVRVLIDRSMADRTEHLSSSVIEAHLADGAGDWLTQNRELMRAFLPAATKRSAEIAEEHTEAIIDQALKTMRTVVVSEVERLRALRKVNSHIRPDEVQAMERQVELLATYIVDARVRLDAMRIIWRGPAENGRPILSH